MNQESSEYSGHTGPITAMAFSPDGTRLASISAGDMTLRVWDVATGKLVRAFTVATKHAYLDKVGFSPDGSTVYGFGHGISLKAWNIESGEPVRAPAKFSGWDVGFSECGRRMVTVELRDPTFQVRAIDVESLKSRVVLVDEDTWPEYGAIQRFSKDLSLFAADTLDLNGEGSIYDASTGEILYSWSNTFGFLVELPTGPAVINARLVGDDERSDRYLEVIDPLSGKQLFRFDSIWPIHSDQRYRVAIGIPRTHKLVYACWDADAALIIDLVNPGWRIRIPRGLSDSRSLAADRFGRYFAIGEESGRIRIVDVANGGVVRVMGGVLPISSLTISPDSRYLVTAPFVEWKNFAEIEIRLWDLNEKKLLRMTPMVPNSQIQIALADRTLLFDHRLGRLVEIGSPEARLLEMAREIVDPMKRFTVQGTSNNGRWLAVLNVESLSLFDVESGEAIGQIPHGLFIHPYRIGAVVSESGDVAAAGFDSNYEGVCFDVRRGKKRRIERTKWRSSALAISPDRSMLAIGDCDKNKIHLRHPNRKATIAVLDGHSQDVTCVAFTPDGKHLISAGNDGQIILWDAVTFERMTTLFNCPAAADSNGQFMGQDRDF